MIHNNSLTITTRGRGFYPIRQPISSLIETLDLTMGLCHIYIPHTSASLIITENFDPAVLRDLEVFMSRLVPDGDPIFKHTAEGKNDMPAHVRAALTQTAVSVPIIDGKLALGTWQSIFLWEQRLKSHRRNVIVTLMS
jgi:secondary thiamine-phosphate synthase enzyme